jgi:hypothetical protein
MNLKWHVRVQLAEQLRQRFSRFFSLPPPRPRLVKYKKHFYWRGIMQRRSLKSPGAKLDFIVFSPRDQRGAQFMRHYRRIVAMRANKF